MENAIASIYNPEVRREVIRSDPKNYNSLMQASQKAVGFVRLKQHYLNPHEHGLASFSHPEAVKTTLSAARGGTEGEVGMETWEGEHDSGIEEPLTTKQLEFCVFDETPDETAF